MVMHSKLDRVVKHDSVAKYVRKLNFWKTRCKFISVEGQPHAFFTYNLNHQMYLSTVGEIADFLVELDILAEQNWDTQGEVILEGAV